MNRAENGLGITHADSGTQPQPVGEIGSQLRRLMEQVIALEKLAEGMEQRLAPILRGPCDTNAVREAPTPTATSLGSDLSEVQRRMVSIAERLHDISERIALY